MTVLSAGNIYATFTTTYEKENVTYETKNTKNETRKVKKMKTIEILIQRLSYSINNEHYC